MDTFDRSKHIYASPDLDEIIKSAICFFNATSVYPIPISKRFHGTGVYALYCVAKSGVYSKFGLVNRTTFRVPIYVGKAVPKGWRQARQPLLAKTRSYELSNRIREHSHSIALSHELNCSDFFCRFIILEGKERDLISTIEAALIREYQPLWNTLIDGFGNHDPGKGRYAQAKSDWDVCHPGRPWAERCQGIATDKAKLLQRIEVFMNSLEEDDV